MYRLLVTNIFNPETGIFGKGLLHSNHFPKKIVTSCGSLLSDLGKAALQLSPEVQALSGHGRCKCRSEKALKFSWKDHMITSFFGGCRSCTVKNRVPLGHLGTPVINNFQENF